MFLLCSHVSSLNRSWRVGPEDHTHEVLQPDVLLLVEALEALVPAEEQEEEVIITTLDQVIPVEIMASEVTQIPAGCLAVIVNNSRTDKEVTIAAQIAADSLSLRHTKVRNSTKALASALWFVRTPSKTRSWVRQPDISHTKLVNI